MSLSLEPVPTIITDDPRIDMNPDPYFLVEKGAGEIVYRRYPSSGGTDAGSIQFNTQLSDRRTIVSSKVFIQTRFNVTVALSGVPAGAITNINQLINELQGLAPRFSPLMSCTTGCTLTLNGKQTASPVGRYFPALMKYCVNTEEAAYDFSTFPSRQDVSPQTFRYEVVPAPITITSDNTNLTSGIGTIYDSDPYQPSKRSTWLSNVATDFVVVGPQNFTFSFVDEEILPLSPLIWGHREVKGISGLDTLDIYIQYSQSQLNKSFMYCPLQGAVPITATFTVTPVSSYAEFIYFEPRVNSIVPPVLRYRYNFIQHVPKNITDTVGPYNPLTKVGSTFNFTSDTITLQGLPKRIYIFVRRQQEVLKSSDCDTYARIDNVRVDIGNRVGLLGEAQPQALYRMAVKNGYQGSWDNWYNQSGSVICIDLAEDIPLGLTEAPGTLSKLTLQYTIQGTGLYYDYNAAYNAWTAPALECNTVIVYEGMTIIKDGGVVYESNNLSPLDVINSSKVHHVHYSDLIDYSGGMYSAGSIASYVSGIKKGIQRGIGKAKELANKAAPYIAEYGPKVAKVVEKAAPVVASLLAAGYTENEIYNMMEKPAVAKAKGGKRAPKSTLKARAIKM